MLLETISLYYGIPILGEQINKLIVEKETLPSSYKLLILNDSRAKDGVLRLHPRHFYPRKILELTELEIKLEFELFNFKQYDKIYFTYRESITDLIASYFVADQLNTWTYQDNKPFENIEPMEFNQEHHKIIESQIYREKLVIKLKEYFKYNDIKFMDLFYNDIPSFVEEQYLGTKTFHIETNYDYKSIIKNYDDILPLYNHYKNKI